MGSIFQFGKPPALPTTTTVTTFTQSLPTAVPMATTSSAAGFSGFGSSLSTSAPATSSQPTLTFSNTSTSTLNIPFGSSTKSPLPSYPGANPQPAFGATEGQPPGAAKPALAPSFGSFHFWELCSPSPGCCRHTCTCVHDHDRARPCAHTPPTCLCQCHTVGVWIESRGFSLWRPRQLTAHLWRHHCYLLWCSHQLWLWSHHPDRQHREQQLSVRQHNTIWRFSGPPLGSMFFLIKMPLNWPLYQPLVLAKCPKQLLGPTTLQSTDCLSHSSFFVLLVFHE
ncbi:hypothetical protein P7K49_001013 [Saguinus oedipus]|uniref:Uncharacterized protein n=1 Tax=Saguinus oedipus TaxID=9490 RepID=A0ABQ9WD97_SAGOE|nr:hypothetical protein P7K49_001013 [Saguinus oedipus]